MSDVFEKKSLLAWERSGTVLAPAGFSGLDLVECEQVKDQ